MDSCDFVTWKKGEGIVSEVAEAEWEKLLADPTVDGEHRISTAAVHLQGEYILRDDSRYVDSQFKEGSTVKKNMSQAEQEAQSILGKVILLQQRVHGRGDAFEGGPECGFS